MAENLEKALEWVKTLADLESKFSLGPIIGQGDSAVVHEATDSEGQLVAIKIVEETQELIVDAYNEFQIMSIVCNGNPKFPKFLGAYKSGQTMPSQIWFVMELCEEGSVKDLLVRLKAREQLLKEDMIAYILREVVLGLKDLHDQNIVHHDVKASNILIGKNGDVKLCDFGFARKVDETFTVVGSPYWMAPEVVMADQLPPDSIYDTRIDVWSLGITAVELGECDVPNFHVYAPRVMFQIMQNPPPGLTRPSDWNTLYTDFITECLEKNPDHRPWSTELAEHHPFITVADQANRIRASLLHLVNQVRDDPLGEPVPEITVKSDLIKMSRTSAPQRMYRDDLATLNSVTEDSVMETLNQRFSQGNIYTFIGDILLSINPFQERPLYGTEVANKYKYRARCDNAPHIYAVGDRAVQDMLHHQELQNIILTGETGSGKTTAGKHLLWHLCNMTANNPKMVERMLKTSIILEAFGNASTIFNSNSTRHIQYFELTFTKTGKLSGGILWAYCLEKWRVTNCGRNQSNFHIFYYLMDTLIENGQTEKYFLEKGKYYEYLPPSPSHTPEDNVDKLCQVKEAMNLLDFSLEEQETLVQILCAILLIGQIRFVKEGDETEVQIQNPQVVEKIAELLGVEDKKKLKWTFTNYCVVSGGEAVRGKNDIFEAEETKTALARSLYCRLVDFLVNLINTKLSFTRLVFGDQNCLGLLDIPGFECFAMDNTLDQFLVNVTNEQMQFFYNQRVFIWEMQDYENDELSQSGYNFHDNRELLDIILSKPIGFLAFLDEETTTRNNCQHFLDEIEKKLETRFIRVADAHTFTVFHYSGQVRYDARNFIERNKNFLSPEMIQVLRDSKNPTVSQLFTNQMTKTGNLTSSSENVKQSKWTTSLSAKPNDNKKFNTKSRGKYSQSRQMQTIAATMRNSLLEMLQKVSQGSAHFVRCLRSNLKSCPITFDRDLIRYQIRALGLVESIRARQLGYSRRLEFHEFLRRYKFLAFDFDEPVEETKENCRLLLIRLKMEGWALGKTKVFLKYYNEEFLSRLYENQVHKIVKIQSLMRAFLARQRTNVTFPRLAEIRQAKGHKPQINSDVPKLPESYETPGYANICPMPAPRLVSVKPLRQSPPETEDVKEQPPSREEIAKKFEARAKDGKGHELGARYQSGQQSPRPLPSSSKSYINSQNKVKSPPNVISPLAELVNYANKAITENDDDQDMGPFNFRALLKKSKTRSEPPNCPAPLPPIQRNKLADEGSVSPKRPKRFPGESNVRKIPLPGMTSNGNAPKLEKKLPHDPKVLSQIPIGGGHIEEFILAPGVFLQGIVSDL